LGGRHSRRRRRRLDTLTGAQTRPDTLMHTGAVNDDDDGDDDDDEAQSFNLGLIEWVLC
jgi:hypothetical protein